MSEEIDYSKYICPYAHIEKDCGHHLNGPKGFEKTYSVWCDCGYRGPVFALDPVELRLKKKGENKERTLKPCPFCEEMSKAQSEINEILGDV